MAGWVMGASGELPNGQVAVGQAGEDRAAG